METNRSLKKRFSTSDLPALAWSAVLISRVWETPFTGILFFFTSALLANRLLKNLIKQPDRKQKLLHLTVLVTLALTMPRLLTSYKGSEASLAGAILAIVLTSFVLFGKTKKHVLSFSQLTILSVAAITGFLPMKSYHNLFRSMPFEAYVTEKNEIDAREIIEAATPLELRDTVSRNRELQMAAEMDSARDLFGALSAYERALDADPYSASGYLLRGKFRLYRLELTDDTKNAAIRDFTNAILLDPNSGAAYFYRAQATSCLDPQPDFCQDLERSVRLDSTWAVHALEIGKIRCPELSSRLAAIEGHF